MTGRQFAIAMFLLAGATVCAPFTARAECRSEAGFTACPDADFKKLMEKLAAARGEAKTCAVDLASEKRRADDTQVALDAALAGTPPKPRSRVPFLVGAAGATLLASTPWLTSSDAGRAATATAGVTALVVGWYTSEW